METATISQIKNHLSAYLMKVRAGEQVLILDRSQPVARLEPITADKFPNDRLTRFERSGLIRRATQPLPLELLKSTPPKSKESVLQALLDERQEGR